VSQLLFAHGDVPNPLEPTFKLLDQFLTDFITSLAFETARAASTAGRQKIKVEDVKFACRKHPGYLGKMEDVLEKTKGIKDIRKLVKESDGNLDKGLGDTADGMMAVLKGGAGKGKKRKLRDVETEEAEEEAELGEGDDDLAELGLGF